MMMDLFGHGFSALEDALIARERMQGVHASNIANADTPNYRADTRTFQDFLAARMHTRESMPVFRTHPAHQDLQSRSLSLSPFQRAVQAQRMDGNTVDAQKEAARMAENQLMHELTLRLLKGRIDGLNTAIKEGSR